MKTITLHFSDDAFARFRTEVGLQIMAGKSGGTTGVVLTRIVLEGDTGGGEATFKTREERAKEEQ